MRLTSKRPIRVILLAVVLLVGLSACTPYQYLSWQQATGRRAANSDELRQFLPRSQGGLAPRDSTTHRICYEPASSGRRDNPCPAGSTGPLTAAAIYAVVLEANRVGEIVRALNQSPEAHVRAAAREFGIPEEAFVRVIRCESGMNPRAVNASSGALGLGQHLPRYYGARAAALGYSYDSWSDPRANARVSAWLWATSGPGHWVCR